MKNQEQLDAYFAYEAKLEKQANKAQPERGIDYNVYQPSATSDRKGWAVTIAGEYVKVAPFETRADAEQYARAECIKKAKAQHMKTQQTKHAHKFTRSKPSATVETCTCGKFQFTEYAGPAIVAVDPPAPETQPDTARHSPDCNVSLGFAKGEICNCHMEAMQQAVKESAKLSPARHSPLPWSLSGITGDNYIMARQPEGRIRVAEVFTLYDREFIVRAVNNADKLAEAVRMACRVIEGENLDEAMAGEYEILTDALADYERSAQ